MRGQGFQGLVLVHLLGITPADAGTSLERPVSLCSIADHPRGCGDKLAGFEAAAPPPGSPPRMRGQVRLDGVFHLQLRITPADAGTRHMGINGLPYATDHPRGCGDKGPHARGLERDEGSPPRMRGQELLFHQLLLVYRITPADAGTSNSARSFTVPLLDHPRGCGDKLS